MKFLPRAATFAAVTFCAGALANAATLDVIPLPAVQDAPVQQVNVPQPQVVPAPKTAAASEQGNREIVQPLPQDQVEEDADYASLSAAVASQDGEAAADRELTCLATGIYYEAKSEPLAGQLAVADVILNRTTSGRFPKSVCSVVTQPGQFSFVRGGKLPTPPANAQWRKAMAIAQVAKKDLWESPAGDALYFHARYSKASWNRARVATVGNHIFYR
jgi:spore germination cell wall hydrolase CwlJ-like protein